MKTYVCLVSKRRDSYDRYWVRSHNEELSSFKKRMADCYGGLDWQYEIYEANSID